MINLEPSFISIPKCLPEALAKVSTGERNAISTFLVLKAINESGKFILRESIKKGKEPVYKIAANIADAVAQLCKQSSKTVYNHIDYFLSEKLAVVNGEILHLCTYDELCKHFGLQHSGRSRYRVKPTHRKISHIIEVIALQQYKDFCKQTWKFKTENNPALKIELQNVVGKEGFSFSGAVWHSQQAAILSKGLHFDEDEMFVLMQNRADFEINYKSISKLFGYESKGAVAYLKRKWAANDLADIKPRCYKLDYDLFSKSANRKIAQDIAGKIGAVIWDNKSHTVCFKTCDAITVKNWNERTITPENTAFWKAEIENRLKKTHHEAA